MTIADIPFGKVAMARRVGWDTCSHVHLSSTGECLTPSELGVIIVPIADVAALGAAGWAEIPAVLSMPPSPRPPDGPLPQKEAP